VNDHDAPQKLVSAFVLATFLGCSPATVYQRAKQRLIPCYRLGDRILFDLDEVLQAIRQPAETEQIEIPKLASGWR
jgi:excisionase family DNA binding protein